MYFRICFLLLIFIVIGCERSALLLYQQKITPTYLASTNVGSPDPSLPPNGQMLIAEWWIPGKIRDLCPILRIHILFQDLTETSVEFPIQSKIGYKTYFLLNKEFKKKKGFLAYKGEIITADETTYATWQHQLWVKLIQVPTEEMSSAVEEKSRQASVIETPLCNVES